MVTLSKRSILHLGKINYRNIIKKSVVLNETSVNLWFDSNFLLDNKRAVLRSNKVEISVAYEPMKHYIRFSNQNIK